jgi:hypothetical protein
MKHSVVVFQQFDVFFWRKKNFNKKKSSLAIIVRTAWSIEKLRAKNR